MIIGEGKPCLFPASEEKIMFFFVLIVFITVSSDTKYYKSYTIWHKTKTNKATWHTKCALESWESKLSNAHLVCHVALLVFVLCQLNNELFLNSKNIIN